MSSKVWVIGAGKGGVGKTFVTSCLGITLAKLNFSVLMIDLDLSGANLHTNLGLPLSKKTVLSYINGQEKISDLIQTSQVPRLSYVQGVWDSWIAPELPIQRVHQLIEEAHKLNYDYVLIDLGPGASEENLEFFELADEKILVTTPEPTSLEKTYRLIEGYVCHSLKKNMNDETFGKLISSLRSYRETHPKGHFSFREYVNEKTGLVLDQFEQLSEKPIRLILNECRSRQDQDLGFSVKSVCQKYFDLRIDYLGPIDFDNAVWQSVKTREPMLIDKPFTPLAGQFLSICRSLSYVESHLNPYRAVV